MPTALDKTLEFVHTYSGTLASSFAYTGGVVAVRNAECIKSNYAYIPNFGRYYYIDSINMSGDTYLLTLRVDVLTTYQKQIKSCSAVRVYSDNGDVNASNREYTTNGVIVDEMELTPINGFSSDGSIIMITIKGNK